MKATSNEKQIEDYEPLNRKLADRVRLAILQRLRKQMARLSASFFDELDDFLFGSGQQGKFSDDSMYLKAMREFRAKQTLFEDNFLSAVFDCVGKDDEGKAFQTLLSANSTSSNSEAIYESVEIDLALDSMERKANKVYAPFIKQINNLNRKLKTAYHEPVINSDFLIVKSMHGFTKSQHSFSIPLEVRLVFMKLFEQHFVLKMEKLYLDIISILTNVNNGDFVDRLVSSSSAFKKVEERITRQGKKVNTQTQKAAHIEPRVNQAISISCEQTELPLFVEKVIRAKWRAVLFLIGLNKGVSSIEWQEANQPLSLLVNYFNSNEPVTGSGVEELFEKLKQGFGLIQMDSEEQDKIISQLKSRLPEAGKAQSQALIMHAAAPVPEALISPVGERVLDQDDLREISKIMNAGSSSNDTESFKSPMAKFLAEIDALECPCAVEYKLGDQFVECELSKGFEEPASYQIKSSHRRFSISRSNLGLAICLRDAEVRLPESVLKGKPIQVTEFQPG